MFRLFAAFVPLVGAALVLSMACGGDSAASGADAEPSTELEIVSRNLRFDKRTLVALPNREITIVHTNRDRGTLHNVSIYTDRSVKERIHESELFKGNDTRTERFMAPGPGSYYFRCDVHPDTMTGTLLVKEPDAAATAR
jgi:plastocyanin